MAAMHSAEVGGRVVVVATMALVTGGGRVIAVVGTERVLEKTATVVVVKVVIVEGAVVATGTTPAPPGPVHHPGGHARGRPVWAAHLS
mgnify:CR=1 FL=1